MSILFIVAAVFLLGVMVMIHEFGHFCAARMTGIPVKEFAIGFGPKLLSWQSKKHGTVFLLRLIPAGGYCMFYGDEDAQGAAQDDPRCINRFSVWKRMLTIAMGPIMNFVLALVAAICLYLALGEGMVDHTVIAAVDANGPAAQSGVMAGDVILAVNGEDAQGTSASGQLAAVEMIGAYRDGDAPLTLTVRRGESTAQLHVTPRYDEAQGRALIGVNVSYTVRYQPIGLPRAVGLGAQYCVRAAGAILNGLKNMITTGQGLKESSGPVGIVQYIAEETQKSGWTAYVELLVLISVNLGLFNLIPIPGLDGSRIVFLLIEAIRRKPVNQKIEAYVHLSGYVLLFGLMLLMTCKDILHIFR